MLKGPNVSPCSHRGSGSPFFEGETFHSVLRAVQAQPRKFKVYEKAGTLRISVQDVKNVQQAKVALESVVGETA